MGLFEDILAKSHSSYMQRERKKDSAFAASRNSGPITDELRGVSKDTNRSDNAIDSMLGNPTSVDNVAASLAQRFSPTLAKPKYAKFGSKIEAVDASIPEGHPMSGIGTKVRDAYEAKLRDAYGTGASQAELQSAALRDVITPEVVEKSYEYKAKEDSSIKNYFGLFGESKVKALPGFEEWKQGKKSEKEAEVTANHTNHDMLNFGLVAGLDAAVTVGGAALAGTAAALSAPVVVGGALIAGALAIPAGRVAGYMSEKFSKSDFGTFHEDDAQGKIVGATVGAAALAAGGKGKVVRSALGATGAALGALDPALGIDLLGWTGAEAALRHGGEAALSKLIRAGKINESSFEALRSNGSAAKVIDKFQAEKASKVAAEAVTADGVRKAAEKALYEAEFARLEKGDRLSTVLQKRMYNLNHADDAVKKDPSIAGDVTGDAIELADELQLARRLATPGGPNAVTRNELAAPVVKSKSKSKGKGKGAVVVSAVDEIEKAHFNSFLDEMKSHNSSEWVASVDRMLQGQKERDVFTKLYNVAEKPTSLSDGLSSLSWDGLNKVIGDGAEAGWKTLSIGERVQIVSDVENAAHAAQVRSLGTVPGASRLEEIKKPLKKALADGLKDTPEALAGRLQAVIEGPKSPYAKAGNVDLQTLQVDLADFGFDSVQQLAFAATREGTVKAPKKLAAFEEAVTALRNGSGSNLVKLGFSGIVGSTIADSVLNAEYLPQIEIADGTVAAEANKQNVYIETPENEHKVGTQLGDAALSFAEVVGKKLDPLVSLLGPAEAEAGGFDAAAKLVGNLKISQAAAIVAKDAGDGVTAMKYAYDAGLVFQDLPKGALSARGVRTGFIDTAPKGEAEMQQVIRRLTNAVPGQSFTTPYFNSQTLLKTANDGDRFLGNPAIQLAHGQSAVSHNSRQSFEILDNIYKVNGIKLIKEHSKTIEETMLPVQKAFDGVATELRAQEAAAVQLRKTLAYLEDEASKGAEFAANMAPIISSKKLALAEIDEAIKTLKPSFDDATKEVEIAHRSLASRFPEARLSLAIEDTADLAERPWLKDMLSPGEKRAVLQIQDLMTEYKERITSVMGKDAVLSRGYIKHSRAILPEQVERLSSLEAKLNRLGLNGKDILALTKLHERTRFSQQMIPDVGRNMADYVPDVETRLMNADFWNKWKPFKDSTTVKESPALSGMFDRIAASAKPPEDTMLRRLSTNYAKVETVRLLAGLASAPAKHLFKVLGDVSQLGLLNTTVVMKDAGAMAMRNFVRIQGDKLYKAGFLDKKVSDTLFTKTKSVDSFVAAVINQRGMIDYLSDIEKTYGVGHRSAIDKILDPLTDIAGVGIKVIETFDRTVSVLAAARMAQKPGLTGQQSMYGIYDTILKNNFLSGQLNSAWAKDPNVRALFLFQNTPFKIWERRISNAVIAGGDLKTAMGVIKAQELPAALAELQGMRKWAAQAAQAFKSGMLQDALKSSKDVFGNSVTGQFVREALGAGVVLSGGSALGVNLHGHMLHTPFVSTGYSGSPEVSMSPVTKAAVYASTGKKPAGFDDWDSDDDHSVVVDFFRHWYGTAGFSLMASKFGRISNDDIPEQYKDSKFKFLFAMPAVEE